MSPTGKLHGCRSAVCSLKEACEEVSQAHLHCNRGARLHKAGGVWTYLQTCNNLPKLARYPKGT